MTKPLTFQETVFRLKQYWSDRGCIIQEPHDVEVGAGTMAPDMPIMMVQRSPSILFQTSNAKPSCLPWKAVPCIRVRISEALVAPTGSNGRVGVDSKRALEFSCASSICVDGE